MTASRALVIATCRRRPTCRRPGNAGGALSLSSRGPFRWLPFFIPPSSESVLCFSTSTTANPNPATSNGTGTGTGTGSSSADTNALIARALYRQLLRWCKATGSDVPLGHTIPPVTLTSPHVDAAALKILASVPTNKHGEYLHDTKATSSGNNDDSGGSINSSSSSSSSTTYPYAYLHGMLPHDAVVDENMMIVPIKRACPDLSGLIRTVYRLNAPVCNPDTSTSTNISSTDDAAHILKDRISLGFETMRSLNELSSVIEQMKLSREAHSDRTGVRYYVGQVVRHKADRWRGVVAGWKRGSRGWRQQPVLGPGGGTSLTTKDYGSTRSSTGAASPEEKKKEEEEVIRYDVIIDSGDSHLLSDGGRRGSDDGESGFPFALQDELEIIEDDLLVRIRSHWVLSKFDRFDVQKGRFMPSDVVRFEYPLDGVEESEDNDAAASATALPSDEIAKDVVEGVRSFSEYILEMVPSRNGTVLWSLRQKLSAVSSGTLHDPEEVASLVANAGMSMQQLATMQLRSLLDIILEVSEMTWQRRNAMKEREKIRFPLGTIVRHKKYGFRGVVVAWDSKPAVDVSRWDGLQDVENPQEKPFYHVIPDVNDCVRAFGAERHFRYVVDDNLEPCPKNQSVIDVPYLDTEEWVLNPTEWNYSPPDVLKFKYAESLGEDEDMIVNAILFVKRESAKLHLASRDGGLERTDPLFAMANALSLDNILKLLHDTDNLNDAASIEEWCKEVWKAHADEDVRRRLDDGLADLLRDNKERALARFSELVQDEPAYAEAYNKKSTCHYMLGQMNASLEAARAALHLAPTNFQALSGLGLVQYETRRYQLAAETFRRSLQLDPWGPISSRLSVCIDLLEAVDIANSDDTNEETEEEDI